MNASERIPPLLASYIALPCPGSLGLVTSTVSTTANWVLLRYLYAALGGHAQSTGAAEGSEAGDVGVVLVSWMRDVSFWTTEARRAVGVDLGRLEQQGRFAFVDGLNNLFTASLVAVQRPNPSSALSSRTTTSSRSALPVRGPAPSRTPPTRQPLPVTRTPPPQLKPLGDTPQQATSTPTLTSPTLASIQDTITHAIASLTTKNVLLILDTPSLLLHTTNPPITTPQLTSFLLTLRANPRVHSIITAIPADTPFLAPAEDVAVAHLHNNGQNSGSGSGFEPLARDNAAFMVSLAHMAKWVLSCRMLGTGWAEDVSGVVRVTRGGCADEDDEEYRGDEVKEGEWLYHVSGDASVKVWGRGESGR